MYVLMLLLTFIITSRTASQAYEYSINVGTVLFSPSDRRKSHWSKTELGLIRARRYFQELLPPPSFIDTTNEEYIHTLLKYFKDTYSTIKREAKCPVSDSLLTTAFSDALGGYLKLWVLPISKLSFYGGTVSQDNILKLYNFHNEIKRYMGTDGNGWRSPDRILLKSITINIAPPRHISRSMKDPCQHLAYYEKTDNGMAIPTPHIDWNDESHTMFVPLRNQSLIPLDSPNYPNTLFKYYDAAKNCIDESNGADQNEFEDRFQTWLDNDVVPHLSDEHVYLPLGSVLTLANKSRNLYEKFKRVNENKIKPLIRKYTMFGIPIDFKSKKTWVIAVILFLEIAWCIPALIYLAFAKKKKRKENNIYTLLDACRHKATAATKGMKPKSKIYKGYSNKNIGFKIENRPRSENLEIEPHYFPSDSKGSAATDTRSYFGSNACSAVSVIHETMPPPLKSSLKKIRSSHTAPIQQHVSMKQSKSNRTCVDKKPCKCKKCTPQQSTTTNSYSTVQTELIKSVTSRNEINEPLDDTMVKISNTTHVKSSSDLKRKNIPSIQIAEPKVSEDIVKNCPCFECLETEVSSEITVVNQEKRPREVGFDKIVEIDVSDLKQEIKTHEVCFDNNVEMNKEDLKKKPAYKSDKKSKNIGLRLESGRPYLEIKIDKPQAEISVGIGGIFDPLKSVKRSKIPKRLPKTYVQMASTSPMRKESPSYLNSQKPKSLIPQPKKRPVDDMDVKPREPASKRKDSKLNVTL